MGDQIPLDLKSSLDLKFDRFHSDNPHVYEILRDLALQAKNAGQRVGIGCLWEVLRWKMLVDVKYTGEYKLNNSFRSRYARMLMFYEPSLKGFFETRILRS